MSYDHPNYLVDSRQQLDNSFSIAVETAQPLPIQMAFVTTRMTALAKWMPAAFAMALAPFMIVDAEIHLTVIAIVTAINWTRLASAAETALLT